MGAVSANPQAASSAVCVGGGVRHWQSCVSILQHKDPAMSSALGLEEMDCIVDP